MWTNFTKFSLILLILFQSLCAHASTHAPVNLGRLPNSRRGSSNRIRSIWSSALRIKGSDANDRLGKFVQENTITSIHFTLVAMGLAHTFTQTKSNAGALLFAGAASTMVLSDLLQKSDGEAVNLDDVRHVARGRDSQLAVFALLAAMNANPQRLFLPLLMRTAPFVACEMLSYIVAAAPENVKPAIESSDRSMVPLFPAFSNDSFLVNMVEASTQAADLVSLVLEARLFSSILRPRGKSFGVTDLAVAMVYLSYMRHRSLQLFHHVSQIVAQGGISADIRVWVSRLLSMAKRSDSTNGGESESETDQTREWEEFVRRFKVATGFVNE